MNCILESMMFHLHMTSFATQIIPLKRRLNVTKTEEFTDPEPSKRRKLVLVYFEKNVENKQKQQLRGVLIVEVFCK